MTTEWPKTVTYFIHGDDDSAREKAHDIGLTGEAARNFRPGYEVELTLEVYEDGTSYATHINSEELVRKLEI